MTNLTFYNLISVLGMAKVRNYSAVDLYEISVYEFKEKNILAITHIIIKTWEMI